MNLANLDSWTFSSGVLAANGVPMENLVGIASRFWTEKPASEAILFWVGLFLLHLLAILFLGLLVRRGLAKESEGMKKAGILLYGTGIMTLIPSLLYPFVLIRTGSEILFCSFLALAMYLWGLLAVVFYTVVLGGFSGVKLALRLDQKDDKRIYRIGYLLPILFMFCLFFPPLWFVGVVAELFWAVVFFFYAERIALSWRRGTVVLWVVGWIGIVLNTTWFMMGPYMGFPGQSWVTLVTVVIPLVLALLSSLAMGVQGFLSKDDSDNG